MKKILAILLLLISYVSSFSQTTFEKGYFINNNNERVECYIENLDLLNNPKRFSYKLDLNSKKSIVQLSDAKVFEIYNVVKYERHTVNIDRSSELIDEISTTRKPNFNEEQLFLKVLLEGKVSLYKYAESKFIRFFFKNENQKIEQLVFKLFTTGFDSSIRKNEQYKQQLMNSLNCENLKKGSFSNLKYQKSKLINLFINYHDCIGTEYKNYIPKKVIDLKSRLNLTLRPGLNISSTYLESGISSNRDLDYGTKYSPRIGLELEVIFGFNNNKWALTLEPTYLTYSSKTISSLGKEKNIQYNSIEVPLAIRHYLFLNENSKFFLSGMVIPDFPIDSQIGVVEQDSPLKINSQLNYGFGIGYKYKNKFSAELRVATRRELLSYTLAYKASYRTASIIFGYTIF
jgi:hypothetical protein